MSASIAPPSPPAEPSPEEEKLAVLRASAEKAYALKQYAQASELFADACEQQAKIHGSDTDLRNAPLLYQYGKSLFQVAVSKSDVLGGVTASKNDKKKDKAVAGAIGQAAKKDTKSTKKGLFSFQGDENWDDSDEELSNDDEAEEEAEEDDDFANAWEILDLVRVLFHKRLDPNYKASDEEGEADTKMEVITEGNKDAAPEPLSEELIKEVKTNLADTYDILGEISLESESFPQAVKDLRSALDIKLEIYAQESSLLSEAHFKLSLALEFEAAMEGASESDQLKGREAAAEQMELAIQSCKARIAKEEDEIRAVDPSTSSKGKGKGKGKAKEVTSDSLVEAREIVGELEQRLADLRAPPPSDELESANPMISGILKNMLGESLPMQKQKLEDAVKNANDVSAFVRKKEKKLAPVKAEPAAAPSASSPRVTRASVSASASPRVTRSHSGNGAGKRKLQDLEKMDVEGKRVVDISGSKKAKVEDTLDEEEKEGGSARVVLRTRSKTKK